VDDFLAQLDAGLARRVPGWRGDLLGIPFKAEFYHVRKNTPAGVRALTVQAGAIRYRIFWARIGDGLYIANLPDILDELQRVTAQRSSAASSDRGPVAQAMVRLRPGHASLALPGWRLGWEEANRAACHRNLGMLSAAARAFSYAPPVLGTALDHETRERLVRKYATRLYGCEFACPDGGHYRLAEDGRSFSCDVHGSAANPQQPLQPVNGSRMEQVTDATATLLVTPDVLRVVFTMTPK
jgi:hypothetical protein